MQLLTAVKFYCFMYFKCSKCLNIDSLLVANIYDGDKRFNVLSHLSIMLHKFTQNSCKLVAKTLIIFFSLVYYFAKVVAN